MNVPVPIFCPLRPQESLQKMCRNVDCWPQSGKRCSRARRFRHSVLWYYIIVDTWRDLDSAPGAKWKASGRPPVSACPEHRRNSGPMWAIHPLSPFPCPLLVLTPQHTYSRGLPGLCAFRDDTPNRGPREFRGQVGWWVWTSTWRQSRVRRRCGMWNSQKVDKISSVKE